MATTLPDLRTDLPLGPRVLSAGVVAHNEEVLLRPAVRSLLDQELPEGVDWREIWVVASGCTDGTVSVAEALAREDPRIRVVVEPDRGGKARALGEVFRRASGDALVLLNSDARAEPGSVGQLLRTANGKTAPFAVMGRPVVGKTTPGGWSSTLRWMWDLHHEFHSELLAQGRGGHLSDELLMVSLATAPPPIPPGIINDGAFLAVWLGQHEGGRWYSSEARVSIQVPSNLRDHLSQRRRIHVGNVQVSAVLGRAPASVPRQFLERPSETLRLLFRMLARPGGARHFASIAFLEGAAHLLAAWDRLPPRKDHIGWQRIRAPSPALEPPEVSGVREVSPTPARTGTVEDRVAALLRVADEFGTGLPLRQLRELLPVTGPETDDALRSWLEARPALARLDGPRAYAPHATHPSESGREERARAYREYAERLWSGPLLFAKDLVRCAGITGSTAFGEPRSGDDLDLFVVVRSGALWWFLARTYLALHLRDRRRATARGPTLCLNYVLEDGPAGLEFARGGDLLFAREALSVRVMHGDAYYRGLVASAPWMRAEFPRLFDARSELPGSIEPVSAPPLVRALSTLVFPFLATYLQVMGIWRNARYRRQGASAREFRTVTGLRRLSFVSHRFEQLRAQYTDPWATGPTREGRTRAGRTEGAR